MCEQSTANDVAALRREARRRKILENSTSRLKLIEGVLTSSSSNFPLNDQTTTQDGNKAFNYVPEPQAAKPLEGSSSDERPKKMSEIRQALKSNNDLKKISELLLEEVSKKEADPFEAESKERVPSSQGQEMDNRIVSLIIKKRLHYVLLAAVVNMFFYFDIGYFFYDNIFCPFLTVKVIEVLSNGLEVEELEPIMLMLLAGLPVVLQQPGKIILSLFPCLFSDLFIYLFTFVMGSKMLNLQIDEIK